MMHHIQIFRIFISASILLWLPIAVASKMTRLLERSTSSSSELLMTPCKHWINNRWELYADSHDAHHVILVFDTMCCRATLSRFISCFLMTYFISVSKWRNNSRLSSYEKINDDYWKWAMLIFWAIDLRRPNVTYTC